MESKECKCTFAQKMVGDGCAVCNPQMAIDILEEANATLIEQNKKLREGLQWLVTKYPITNQDIARAKRTLNETANGNVDSPG